MWRQSTICLFSLNRSRLLAAFADTPSRAAWPANLGAQGSIRKNCERNHKDSDVSDRLSQLSPPHQVLFGTQILRSFPQFQHLHMNKRDSAFNVFERLETSNQTSDLGDFCHRKRTLGRRWKLYTLTGNKAMKVEGVRTLCLKKQGKLRKLFWDSSLFLPEIQVLLSVEQRPAAPDGLSGPTPGRKIWPCFFVVASQTKLQALEENRRMQKPV